MNYDIPHQVWTAWNDLRTRYQDQLLGWRLVVNTRSKNRLGCTKYASKTLELGSWMWSAPNSRENPEILKTLLHEVAHILSPGDAHGGRWRASCRELGIPAERLCNAAARGLQVPPAKYNAGCPSCGRKFWKNRRVTSDRFCPCDRNKISPLRWV